MAGGPWCDGRLILFNLQKKRQEEEELDTHIKERSEKLESLQQRTVELQVKLKKQRKEHLSYLFLKEQDTDQAAEKAKMERKKVLFLDAKLESLKLEHADVMERKQEQQNRIRRHSAHGDLLERTVRMTKFDDVQKLTGHIENLLDVQNNFERRENKAHEQVVKLKKSLLTLEDDHHFQRLQDNNQLSQLQTQIEKTRSETISLEGKWNHIEEMAAKKTLLLGKIKMATFSLYEMANEIDGEKPVNINETEKQLDKVKMFMQTYTPIVKQVPTVLQKYDGHKKDKTKHKKRTVIRTSQDA